MEIRRLISFLICGCSFIDCLNSDNQFRGNAKNRRKVLCMGGYIFFYARLAQMEERFPYKEDVGGSSPSFRTKLLSQGV